MTEDIAPGEMSWTPWMPNEDETLRNLVEEGWTVAQIASTLQRSSGAIRARIVKQHCETSDGSLAYVRTSEMYATAAMSIVRRAVDNIEIWSLDQMLARAQVYASLSQQAATLASMTTTNDD